MLAVGPTGYGFVSKKPEYLAHRLAWHAYRGVIPNCLAVLHRCDNPPCCNPAHLFLGTLADNNADMKAKGRQFCKLTPDKARAIRLDTRSQVVTAKEHGVSQQLVSRVKLGEVWNHL